MRLLPILIICLSLSIRASDAQPDLSKIYTQVNNLESQNFGRTYPNDPVPDRLDRLEVKLFGKPQSGPVVQRLDAILLMPSSNSSSHEQKAAPEPVSSPGTGVPEPVKIEHAPEPSPPPSAAPSSRGFDAAKQTESTKAKPAADVAPTKSDKGAQPKSETVPQPAGTAKPEGSSRAAASAIRKPAVVGPDETTIRLNNEGVHALGAGNFELGIRKLEEALHRYPTYAFAKKNLAKAYNNYGLQLTRTPRSAIKQFHKALWLDPNDTAASQNLDNLLIEMKKSPSSFSDRIELSKQAEADHDLSGAAIELISALKIKDDAAAHDRLAKIFTLLGNSTRAQDESGKAKEAAKKEELARAAVAAKQKEIDAARAKRKDATSSKPQETGRQRKDREQSKPSEPVSGASRNELDKTKTKAIEPAKPSESTISAADEKRIYSSQEATNNQPPAIPVATIAPVIPTPDDGQAHTKFYQSDKGKDVEGEVARAESSAKNGDWSSAIKSYGRALLMKPDDRRILDGLVSSWDSALRLNPLAPENHIGMGQAYFYRDETGMAEKEYRIAVTLSPGHRNPVAQKLLERLARQHSRSALIPNPPFVVSPVTGR